MDMTKAHPDTSKHLKADELGPKARVTVKIASVVMEALGSDTKPVMYFAGKTKGLPLNKTNTNTLIDLFGPESDDWIGRTITIYTTPVEFEGRRVLGIRIVPDANPLARGVLPPKRPVPPSSDPDEMPDADSIPF